MKNFTRILFTGILMLGFFGLGFAQQNQKITSVVGKLVRTTPKLADIDPNTMYGEPLKINRDMNGIIGISEEGEEKLEKKLAKQAKRFADQVIQSPSAIFPNTPTGTINQNFDGLTWNQFDPSDNNLAVGPNHVVQIINDVAGSRFKIWNKSGVVIGSATGTTLSSITGVGGAGDPVVMYDQLADRWVLTEFGPSSCCNSLIIAVSTSPDPTGSYKIYQYTDASFFPDYPKYAVWHNAYYARTSDFNAAGTSYLGASIYAFDRNAMLAGAATATMVRVRMLDAGSVSYYNMNVIGLDGTAPSTQNGLFAVPDQTNSIINLFEFTPNFTTPASSVVGPLVPIGIAPFSVPPASVAQQGSSATIQTLGMRLMYRLSYRKRGSIESILIGHTVAGSPATLGACRWYEFRRNAGAWSNYQQGTIAGSDGNSRIMPALSMDASGNIGMLYNVSGTTSFPSIKYTGRNECDPLGQMTLAEQTIVTGTSAHTLSSATGSNRWGDYNSLLPDPSIIGSFWGTAEYGGTFAGNTRVTNFTISGGSVSFSAQPVSTLACVGATATFSVTATGTPPFTYQWQRSNDNGATWANISGATAATYSFTTVAGDNNAQFRCIASSTVASCGPGTSTAAILTTTTSTAGGTLSPATSNVCVTAGGNSVTLTLAGSIGNIIRWESSTNGGTTWTPIANTTTTYTATSVTVNTLYRAVVSGCSVVNSTNAAINIIAGGVGVLTILNDNGTTLCAGDNTKLTVVGLTSTTFNNLAPIELPAKPNTSGNANPYPATIAVSGVPATAGVASVNIYGLSHSWPSDLSLVLQSPTGQNVILMSAALGSTSLKPSPRNYTFSDAATVSLVAGSPSGTYLTTNLSTTRNWPAPGPGTLVQGTNPGLSTFTGNPNGIWKLYAIDAVAGDSGMLYGGFDISFATTGTIPGLTYAWTPGAGLSSTTANPVSAAPAVNTTYNVVATTSTGCQGSASVAITVNARPVITTQPISVTSCGGTSVSFTAAGSGSGFAYQWQESTNGGTTYNNTTDGTFGGVNYSGSTTGTLTITGITNTMNGYKYRLSVSGVCAPNANSNAATLNIKTQPSVSVNPSFSCGGVPGLYGVLLTATGSSTAKYTWSPSFGLYSDPSATVPYIAGTVTPKVYAAPNNDAQFTVTATDSLNGCTNTAIAIINFNPPAPIVVPNPAAVCIPGTPQALTIQGSSPITTSFSSGAISVAVPDNTANGVNTKLTLAGFPTGAVVSNIKVTLNMPHTWIGDMIFNLKAPNGNILSLDKYLTSTGGAGVTTGFTNTVISNTATSSLSSGSNPYSGTFKPDGLFDVTPIGFAFSDPSGFVANVNNFQGLTSFLNGDWTLAMADGGPGDVGTLTSWKIDITYTVGAPPPTNGIWTPITGLFNDPQGTIPYVAGTPKQTVYTYPAVNTTYSVTTSKVASATNATNFALNNGFGVVTFNVRNNNTFPITITDISSVVSASGSQVTTGAYYNVNPINGAPGAITVANGWSQFGSGSVLGTGTVQPFMSGLNLTIPAGKTYGVLVQGADANGANLGYSTISAGTYTFSNSGVDIVTGTGIGFAGDVVPNPPTFTPRGFVGTLTYNLGTPCTSPVTTVPVIVNTQAKISVQPPASVKVCTNGTTSISVTATGTTPSYQWQLSTNNGATFTSLTNGGIYSGVTTNKLTLTNVPGSFDTYTYRVIVIGAASCTNNDTSKPYTNLNVTPLPVVQLTASPLTRLYPGLRTSLFASSVPRALNGSYQWYRNGTLITDGNRDSLRVVDVNGLGDYTVIATDINGCTSNQFSNVVTIADSASGRVFIYPNPNGGQFQVRYYSATNNIGLPRGINVYDAIGKRVLSQVYSINGPYSRMDVNLSNQSTGVYTIEVVDYNGNRLAVGRAEVLR